MQNYQLTIVIPLPDFKQIESAGEQVVICKTVNGSTGPSIAWIAFSPSVENDLSWAENYLLYASNSNVLEGSLITSLAQSPAIATRQLPFTSSARFDSPTPDVSLPAQSYGVVNLDTTQRATCFGLAQAATLSGTELEASPINASLVPPKQHAIFQPQETIQVFLAPNIDPGMVINQIKVPFISVNFSTEIRRQEIVYAPALGNFVLVPTNR